MTERTMDQIIADRDAARIEMEAAQELLTEAQAVWMGFKTEVFNLYKRQNPADTTRHFPEDQPCRCCGLKLGGGNQAEGVHQGSGGCAVNHNRHRNGIGASRCMTYGKNPLFDPAAGVTRPIKAGEPDGAHVSRGGNCYCNSCQEAAAELRANVQ